MSEEQAAEACHNSYIADLEAELAALRKDNERLDWLQEQSARPDRDITIMGPGNHGGSFTTWLVTVENNRDVKDFAEVEGKGLREAIDIARAALKEGKS